MMYSPFKIIRSVDILTASALLEIKIYIVFLVTAGFSSPKDGRYSSLLFAIFRRRYSLFLVL
jgi:hypothetical protein